MGNVVVTIKPTSATGAAGVTRYIAESKRNPEKEGLVCGNLEDAIGFEVGKFVFGI
jgi:hypothetical protein